MKDCTLDIISIENFVKEHITEDPIKLRFKRYSDTLSFDPQFAISQIECRQKASKKIPHILENTKFLFPTTLLAEQCTDEKIAKFHSSLFIGCKVVADLTAGLCIDSYYISKNVEKVISVEIDENTANIDALNMKSMAHNICVINSDAESYLKQTATTFNGIFIDPARRDIQNSRVYNLSDCSPNIHELLPELERKTDFVIIKASPMLDIRGILKSLNNVSDVWVVGVKNECKEVLIKIDFKSYCNKTIIHTRNIIDDKTVQTFSFEINESSYNVSYSIPETGMYLYEPNSCLMKANADKEICEKFKLLHKLHPNTHLYISNECIKDFPGRIFKIDSIINYKEKSCKAIGKAYPQINVSTRNFRITSNQLKGKLKVKDGGNNYLFGCTQQDDKQILLICSKITF